MVRKLSFVAAFVAGAIALSVAFLGQFAFAHPGTLYAPTGHSSAGITATIHLETVGAIGSALEWPRPYDPHPDWVAYAPTTVLRVPAHALVTVTIDQEDSATGLRNPFWSKVQGTSSNSMHIKYFDDKGQPAEGNFATIDPVAAAHTFAIPDLGVSVPLLGVNASAPANSTNVITFSFRTQGPCICHWQCFVPCGAKTVFGNGGPMQTLGYMAGLLIVQ